MTERLPLPLDRARWVAENLLQPGESDCVLCGELDAEGRPTFSKGEAQLSAEERQRRTDAWESLLVRRWEAWVNLRFDALPIGWLTVAVRVHGDRAEEALKALGPRADWPGREAAEATLRQLLDGADL